MIKKITWIKVVYVSSLSIDQIFLFPADNGTLVAVEEGWVGATSASQGKTFVFIFISIFVFGSKFNCKWQ